MLFPSDAVLGSCFRTASGELFSGEAYCYGGAASSFQHHRRTMLGRQRKNQTTPEAHGTFRAAFQAANGSSNIFLLSTHFPLGWRHVPTAQHTGWRFQFVSCHSVSSSSSDFSSSTSDGTASFTGGFFPAANSAPAPAAAAAAPANSAGVLDVTSDMESPDEIVSTTRAAATGDFLRVGAISAAAGTQVPPRSVNLDLALQQSQEASGQLDVDLQEILGKVSNLQMQNEVMSKQMKDYQDLLAKTVVSLTSKAQEARIEAMKLKKLAILQKAEELRRTEDLRKNVRQILKQEEVQRLKNVNGAAARWQAGPEEPPPAIPYVAGEEEISCEVDDGGGDSEEIADIVKYLKESRAADGGESTAELEISSKLQQERQSEDASKVAGLQQKEEESLEKDIDVSAMTSLSDSMECVVTHPGALSCTKTVIKKDDNKMTAVVTMETSVRCTGDACLVTGLSADDYVTLAIQTLAETSQNLRQNRMQRSRLDADPVAQERHAGIVNILAHGRIVGSRPMEPPSRFGHESFVVQLQDDQTGEKIDALFKPRAYGDAQGWHRAPVEWVAYELNLMLGMDLVPPVAYRRGRIELKCNHQFQEGAFVYYVRNTKELRRVPATGWGVPVAQLLSDTRILDCLLNNSDRHQGHFLLGEHWADRFKLLPVLIDHAAGFRAEAVVNMTDENAFRTGPVRCVSAKTYLRLRFLDKEVVSKKFQGFLKPHEVEQLMERRDEVLRYLDKLVAERGYQRTVIEM